MAMEKTGKMIIRKSIHTFLQNYHQFACTVAFLVLPFSASVLLSQALQPSSSPLLQTIYSRLWSLFYAAGFPPSSPLFSLLSLKLSQTVTSTIFTLPFTISFLLIGKTSIIQTLQCKSVSLFSSFSSFFQQNTIYQSILVTHLCNSFVILSANAAAFSLLFLAFSFLDALELSSPNTILFLSATGAILYSVILANTLIVCNLAIILAGMESCSGFLAILRACMLIRGRAATALSLALPTSLGLAAIEALFQYRVVRAYRMSDGKLDPIFAWEVPLIAYIYSLLIILDTVMGCIFYKSCCKSSNYSDEGQCCFSIEPVEKKDNEIVTTNWKAMQELL
ncbi:hypothetical protein CKAN_01005900 [Cinnamomum micranthum f. kanehirae]|uniref:Transmembrane protein n=1 Tax=Cinnamomum micranthum f. kanehirae TaxID=337451 RepID=A0A3S3MS21_9MAGN|nr:hypothetical protein CKAN_01005900 [Cinnamomum micranthum f. kanehirae]